MRITRKRQLGNSHFLLHYMGIKCVKTVEKNRKLNKKTENNTINLQNIKQYDNWSFLFYLQMGYYFVL